MSWNPNRSSALLPSVTLIFSRQLCLLTETADLGLMVVQPEPYLLAQSCVPRSISLFAFYHRPAVFCQTNSSSRTGPCSARSQIPGVSLHCKSQEKRIEGCGLAAEWVNPYHLLLLRELLNESITTSARTSEVLKPEMTNFE